MTELHELAAQLATPRDLIRWGASQFNEAELCFGHGTDNALDEAASLVLQALHLPLDLDGLYFNAVLTSEERVRVIRLLKRRIDERLPAAYLTGRAWFAGLEFFVDERVLVPRSPLAELIAARFDPWIKQEPHRILDLCTGSGCIAIACAYAFPETAVDATDLSEDALAVARENVHRHGLEARVELLPGDGFSACPGRRYDLILSNPPYVSPAEFANLPAEFLHEPKMGLTAPENGLALVNRILEQAAEYLTEDGLLVIEVGSSAAAILERWPDLPFLWPEFEHGGEGVFILGREQLPVTEARN